MSNIWATLQASLTGSPLTREQWQALADWELTDVDRVRAWGISPGTVLEAVHQRWELLYGLSQSTLQIPIPGKIFSDLVPIMWALWLPLAIHLSTSRDQLGQCLIQGFLGGQGTGKTTLTAALREILSYMGYRSISLSIDDLYKSYAERQQLRQADPRLQWRGPPGTHNVVLGIETLRAFKTAQPGEVVLVPQFDKSLHQGEGDCIQPLPVSDIEIVMFEGWFVGAQPALPKVLEAAPEPIVTAADRQFAQDMNAGLRAYLPLWDLLDSLIVLYPQDYRLSQRWRRDAEQAMKAEGKTGMNDAMIDQFVEYFWKALHPEIFVTPLLRASTSVDLVIEVSPDHWPIKVYSP